MTSTMEDTLIVHDLGEDSEAWLVEGTLDVQEARSAVREWIVECMGDEDSIQFIESLDLAKATIKTNWFWEALADGSTGDDMLTSKDDKLTSIAGVTIFVGVYLR